MKLKEKNQGILFIMMAAFFFALMNLFVRLSGDLPVMEKCFFRNLVAAFAAAFVLLSKKEKRSLTAVRQNLSGLFMRSAAGTAGVICNFYAIDHLNISDASMLNKLSPFFAMVFSVFLLKEKANAAEWGTVAAAFAGALFVVKPSFHVRSLAAVIGVLGGLGAGLAYTYVRKLGMRKVEGSSIVLFFSVFSCLATLPFMLLNYKPMSPLQLLYLFLAGASAAGGQFSITAAYAKAPAKEISVFDYSQVLFAAVLGFLFLGQLPDGLSIVGYVIIIGTAVAKWRYQNRN